MTSKRPETFEFKSLRESLAEPIAKNQFQLQLIDLGKFGYNEVLHSGFITLLKYYDENNELPSIHSNIDSYVTYSSEKFSDFIKRYQLDFEFKKELVENQLRFANTNHAALCSIVGGISAQEVVKFTNK